MKVTTYFKSYSLLLFSLFLVFGSACQKQETTATPTKIATAVSDENNLAFVTIDQYETGGISSEYNNELPSLIVITAPENITLLDDWIRFEQREQLQLLDFDKVFVVAVFQGVKPSTGYNVQIERLEYKNDVVSVFTRFEYPEPETTVGDTVTSPYHFVQVLKTNNGTGKTIFNLVVEGNVVTSYTANVALNAP